MVADFIAGAAERLVLEGSKDADIVLVEGQGSLNHPGYSGVTCGLLHGSCPDALILCHQATRKYIGDYRQAAWLRIPPLKEYVRMYESIAGLVHPPARSAISLNTYDLERRGGAGRLRGRHPGDRAALYRSGALRSLRRWSTRCLGSRAEYLRPRVTLPPAVAALSS